MSDSRLFLLLDIDGVLLEAHGYRLAAVDTVNDMLRLMGQPGLTVDRSLTDAFEANGISAEWDMVPLTLAAFVSWYIERSGSVPRMGEELPDCGAVPMTDAEGFRRMLADRVREYASLLDPALNVIDAVREAFEAGRCAGLQPLRDAGLGGRFFRDTLDPWKCPFFRELMCRIIGSERFAEFYGMPAPVVCEAYLETKDRPILSETWRKLLPELSGKRVWPAVLTYRPTLLPVWDGNKNGLYYVNTPDGECALRLLGWADGRIPMVGSGSLCYIEDKYGLRREYYVKPHPFHALAAVLSTVCADPLEALELARILCETDPADGNTSAERVLPKGEKLRIAVFEDSVSGIECTKNAADVLRKWGYETEILLCGIRTTAEKNQRLTRAGAVLYDDVNAAFCKVLGDPERIDL